ncbi:MAG TPA: SDR family NAD(P)-dependent oxidoreductase [Polyangiaceae bacterium]|jgi:NAD(P)-dependent dehydrogenase (short-subunit alcohol dehydrogenase family)
MAQHKIDADLTGKTALVTGATGGIGKEIARGLARLGATVVLGARNPAKAEATQIELAKEARDPKAVRTMALDVSSLASIRSFAKEFDQKYDALHILVNNAGAWFSDRRESPDGHELTFATNVIGPYLLTKLLAPALGKGKPSRVVNVVSSFASDYDVKDLEWKTRKFDGFKAYNQSKLALRMVTWMSAADLEKDGVSVNAAAPGFVKTDFNQNAHGFTATMINLSAKLFAVSPAEGADTPLWVAASSEVGAQTSKYFEKRKEKDGKFREQAALDELRGALEGMIG